MTTAHIQTAFHAGEWAPTLNARVDLQKYHKAAALLRNFFVDYRGGASTRTGSKYVVQCFKSSTAVRLITFQASFTVGYELEFGDRYIRFIYNGAPVLETAGNITAATQANPGVITQVAHGYATGDWVYITGVGGMTQLNGKFFIVTVLTANTYTLSGLRGTVIDTTAYGAYTAGGTAARIYTIVSPYAAADLALLKPAVSVNTMIICHPSYDPYVLTLITATNWTLLPIAIGSTISAPTNVAASTTLGAGSVNYSYLVTAVDANGQESGPSAAATLLLRLDLRTNAGTNRITWTGVSGALSYNVYKAEVSYTGAVPSGASFGFIGNCTGVAFDDSNISPDFSITPPIAQNPFQGAGVASVAVTVAGAYTTVPTATAAAAPSGGQTATLQVYLGVTVAGAVSGANPGFAIGDILVPEGANAYGGVQLRVTAVAGSAPSAVEIVSPGAISSGNTPANPVIFKGAVSGGTACSVALTWGVVIVGVISAGAGYLVAPGITFSSGAAAATSTLGTASGGNPGLPGYFQQRLVLAALTRAPQSFFMSQPGAPYNFNINNPVQGDNAISAALVSGQLNTIKSMVSMPSGLIMLSDKAAWLVNGGGGSEAITPINAVAHAHSYNGANDVTPIVANFDILYIQSKGSIVRDLTYNFYANIFTGTDISVLSSHLFYGYEILGWAWAEEPFKVVWAVRDDGVLLTLTFMKEQELIGWSHSDTDGTYKSVAVVTETPANFTAVDAIYTVVERTIGGTTVKYIERFAERNFPNGVIDAWQVDAGLQYSGVPTTNFTGGEHLAGKTVTGLADGLVITPFVMAANGNFTLPVAASKVTVGIAFTPQLQTLPPDYGEPTIQSKQKKIAAVTVRVADTLGLKIGTTLTDLVAMKDLVRGIVGSQSNERVTDLVTGDARTIVDPKWSSNGQYFIQQDLPYPATILGVIPEIMVENVKK